MTTTTFPFDSGAMQAAAAQACALMKALANPDRLLLLCHMMPGALSVSQLEAETGIRQPTLSQQLGVLRAEQLVHARRDGKQIFYSVASVEALRVLQILFELYCPPKKRSKR